MAQYLFIAVPAYVFCLLLGCFLFFRPAQAIEMQRKFYLLINWRIEPVDLQREIRMTRYMGIFMIVMVAASMTCSYYMLFPG